MGDGGAAGGDVQRGGDDELLWRADRGRGSELLWCGPGDAGGGDEFRVAERVELEPECDDPERRWAGGGLRVAGRWGGEPGKRADSDLDEPGGDDEGRGGFAG